MKYLIIILFLFSCSKPKAPKLIEDEPDDISSKRQKILKKLSNTESSIEKLQIFYDTKNLKEEKEIKFIKNNLKQKLRYLNVSNLQEYNKARNAKYKDDPCLMYNILKNKELSKYIKIKNSITKKQYAKDIDDISIFLSSIFYLKNREKIKSSREIYEEYKKNCDIVTNK